jgi:hypothetical protein
MAGIVHKKLKLDSMRRYSEKSDLDQMAHYFSGRWSQFANASRNWDADKTKPASPTGDNRLVFEAMLRQASSTLTFEGFCESTYEEFLNSIPSPVIRSGFDPKARNDQRVCMYIDPKNHTLDLEAEWQQTGIVDQRFMYVSRLAVADWNRVIEWGSYRTYDLCEQTLVTSLQRDETLQGVTTVILLGAGSYSKDRRIVTRACSENRPGAPVRIILIDASFYMLIHTFERLSQFASVTGKHCTIEMYCLDFSDAASWRRSVHFAPNEKVTAFLLGGTIGNLRETEFFEVVREVLPAGTRILIAGEFFDTSESMSAAKAGLLDRYRQDAAKDLSLTAINDLLNREVVVKSAAERRNFVEVDIRAANRLPGDLCSSVPETQSVFFRTRGEIHSGGMTFGPLYLVTAKRYVKGPFVETVADLCDLDHVCTVDHPGGETFSHLLFRKRGPIET